jgi:16S rRNA (cytosine1402-N4)-methyltransferase
MEQEPNIPEQSQKASIPPEKPKRRVRYRGTHPRAFHLKYKELDPDKYPETVQKVLASGKTPAGMHRPIMVDEILEFFQPKPGQVAVDCTLGYGGHAAELIPRILPGGKFIGIDTDPVELPAAEARLRSLGSPPESLSFIHSNFAGLPKALALAGVSGADLLLADLGISSMQLDTPERGFSYKIAGPLDLRLNPGKGQSAAEWLARTPPDKLFQTLRDNGDEPHAALISEALAERMKSRRIATTTELADVIRSALAKLPRQVRELEGDAPIRRVFQAIRIEVNDEFGALENLLRFAPGCLKAGGKFAVLTFHSGEDRRVKKSFEAGKTAGAYSQISEGVIRPGPLEKAANPRSTSAKLRWAIKS